MVCDYLRSCYQTRARFHPGSLVESDLIWYWAAEGAQLLPIGSSVHSLNWLQDDEDGTPDIGEVRGAARRWRNGAMPAVPAGTDHHGDDAWYNDGCPVAQTLHRTASGVPIECLPVTPVGVPLPMVNMRATYTRFRNFLCACCLDGGLTDPLSVTVANKTGAATFLPDSLLFRFGNVGLVDRFLADYPSEDNPPAPGYDTGNVQLQIQCPNTQPTSSLSASEVDGSFNSPSGDAWGVIGRANLDATCKPLNVTWTSRIIDDQGNVQGTFEMTAVSP